MTQDTTHARSSKATRKRGELILAMAQHSSLEKAAESVGISRTTAWRMSRTPEFQEDLRKANREAMAHTRTRLQQASRAAVSTLLKVLVDGNVQAATRVRAADCILQHAVEAGMSDDLLARIEVVEELATKNERKG